MTVAGGPVAGAAVAGDHETDNSVRLQGSIELAMTPQSLLTVDVVLVGGIELAMTPESLLVVDFVAVDVVLAGSIELAMTPQSILSVDIVGNITGDSQLLFNQIVEGFTGESKLFFKQTVLDVGDSLLLFNQSVNHPTGDSTLLFDQSVGEVNDSLMMFKQNVYSPIVTTTDWVDWDCNIIVNGIDVSDRVLGQAKITANRNSARIAEFTLILSGPVNIGDWSRQQVEIQYVQNNGATWRRFTGVIETANYDMQEKTMQIMCSDQLQRAIDGYSDEQLHALVDSYWLDKIHSPDNHGWDRLQDILKTSDVAVQFDVNRAIQVTSYENKLIPDFTFDERLILDDSLSITMAQPHQITNTVEITMQSRFDRLYQRDYNVSWRYPFTFCSEKPFVGKTPSRDTAVNAMEDGGRVVNDIEYIPYFQSGGRICNGQIIGFFNPTPDQGMIGFNALAHLRWKQRITDQIKIKVIDQSAVDLYGETDVKTIRGSVTFDNDLAPDWEGSGNRPGDIKNNFISIGDTQEPPITLVADANGNKLLDVVDDAVYDQVTASLTAEAVIVLRQSLRQNAVRFDLPLSPYLELDHTIEINVDGANLKCIVDGITETYNFDGGDPITEVSMSLSKSGSGFDQAEFVVSAPNRIKPGVGNAFVNSIVLDTHIGGKPLSPDEDDNWDGVIMNTQIPVIGSNIYTEQMKIPFTGVPDDIRKNKTNEYDRIVNIAVPDNNLTISA